MRSALALAALSTLVVNEVLYDPEGADAGHEFVEILNTGPVAASLHGLELQVGDGARPGSWQVAWRGGAMDSLATGAFVVVAGDSVAAGTHRLETSLQNGPDAVRLWRDGVVVDLLGYGALSSPEQYEGAPAADVTGTGLARVPDGADTDVNAADFRPAPPTPGRWNAPRRALTLALQAPAPTRLWPYRQLQLQATLRNVGLDSVAAGTYALRAELRAVFGEPYLDAWSLGPLLPLVASAPPGGLAPGDSAVHALTWLGGLGLFRLGVELESSAGDSARAEALLRIGAGAVLVSEILFSPEVGGSEWIELLNRDARPHDLNGWSVADGTGRRVPLAAPRGLAPGEFALLAADTTSPIPALPPSTLRVVARPWPALNNTDGDDGYADAIVLRDPAGIVQDAVVYSAAWGTGRGRSLERLTPDPDARGLLWAPSKAPAGGTPGQANSASSPPGWGTQLALLPNPFSPDGDGRDDLLGIAFEVPTSCQGFQLQVYDTSGRLRRSLAADRLGPGPRRLAWDGSDDAGVAMNSGVYVLCLQLVGGGATSQLRSVGLVRR